MQKSKVEKPLALVLALFMCFVLTGLTVPSLSTTALAAQASPKSAVTTALDYEEGTETENGLVVNARETAVRTFITLSLESLKLGFPSDVWWGVGSESHNLLNRAGIASSGERTQHDVSLLIGFPKVKVPSGKYKGQQLNVFCSARIELPSAHFWEADNIKVLSEPDPIYVFDSWYEVFGGFGNDSSVITVGIVGLHNIVVPLPQHNGADKPVVTETKENGVASYDFVHEEAVVTVEQKPVDITIDDPYSDNYNPGGGGGSTQLPEFIQTIADVSGCSGYDIVLAISIVGCVLLLVVLRGMMMRNRYPQ